MAWWNNLNFMSNPNQSWGAPQYQGDFGASSMPVQQPTITPQATNSVDRFSQLEFPTLQNNSLSKYKDYLNEAPTREAYSPNVWEKIGAALAGSSTAWASKNPGAGLAVTRDFLDDRYNRAVQEWDVRGKGLAQAAGIEENENTNAYRNWQARNDAILKSRDQGRQEKLADADIELKNSTIELNGTRREEILRKANEGKPFEFVDDKGQRVFGAITVDNDGKRTVNVDFKAPDIAGRKQNFDEKESTRNYGLNLAKFGEEKNQNAIGNQFRQEDLGLDARRTRVMEQNANSTAQNANTNQERAKAYTSYLQNGANTTPSVRQQADAQKLAIEDVIKNEPAARAYFTKDNRGNWVPKDPNAYDATVTSPDGKKQIKLSALLDWYADNRLSGGK